jgi:hypothetical protein
LKRLLRYGLWLAMAGTALANKRHFGLKTTWLPHLTANTASLFLPEVYQAVSRLLGLDKRLKADRYPTLAALHRSLHQLIVANPGYVDYVAPVALAYIVSHPKFNIYKGEMAEIEFLGFGLDSIPHSLTAFSLSNMVMDGAETLAQNTPDEAIIQPYTKLLAQHKTLVSALVLAGLTVLYEAGEYSVHQYEESVTGGDLKKMNMMWDPRDTFFDILANIFGWLAAVLLRRR